MTDQPQPFTPGAGRPHLAALIQFNRATRYLATELWLLTKNAGRK